MDSSSRIKAVIALDVRSGQRMRFSAPLFATILALVVLRERIRMRRIGALLVGFAGVLVVLRPDVQAISTGAIFTLCSALAWALCF